MEYAKQRMSTRSDDARYSARSGRRRVRIATCSACLNWRTPGALRPTITAATRARYGYTLASAIKVSIARVTLRCRITMHATRNDEHPDLPLLVRAWDMIIELVSTALRAPPPADCWPHRPSGQSRLTGVRAPTIGGGSQSVMTAAGGEAWKAACAPLQAVYKAVDTAPNTAFWLLASAAGREPGAGRRSRVSGRSAACRLLRECCRGPG